MQAQRNIVGAPDREDAVYAAIDEALARAVIYRAMAQGMRLPAGEGERSLFHPAGRAALAEAAAFLDARRPEEESLLPAVAALRARSDLATDPRTAHSRLFGHSRGLVCPFETEYGPDGAFRQPQELADIAGYYLAFGLRPSAGADERVDHAACECEFMEFLARKEAFALASWQGASDEPESAEWLYTIQGAARRFLREHLSRFGRPFASLLMKEDAEGFHGALGAVLFRFLGKEGQRFGLPAGPATLELRPPLADDTPMACGKPETELIQIQRRPRP